MTGDLLKRLANQAGHDDQADAEARGSHGLPLHMHTIGDAAEFAVTGTGERLGMNNDLAVQAYRSRLANFRIAETEQPNLVDLGAHYIAQALPYCESPIEKAVLPWLVYGDFREALTPIPVHVPNEDPPSGEIFIAPQHVFGRYRLDFAIVCRTKRVSLIVALECDGAAFHDRHNDLRRDAYFAAFRIPTVRATGSEIRTDPRIVVGKVITLVQTWRSLQS